MHIHSLCLFGASFSASALALSTLVASLFEAAGSALGGGDTFCRGGKVNLARTTLPSIWACQDAHTINFHSKFCMDKFQTFR